MNTDTLQLPVDWDLCRIYDAYEFTKKPRGLDVRKNGSTISFFCLFVRICG